jgi:hypothetical protein
MSVLSVEKRENISNLLALDGEYAAPSIVASNVIQKNWLRECARAQKYPEVFWADYASRFEWSCKWDRVLEWDGVHHKWFTGAKTNITINALDRHAEVGAAAIAQLLFGWAKMEARGSSPTGSSTAWCAASPTA